jgi:hypothetical protein
VTGNDNSKRNKIVGMKSKTLTIIGALGLAICGFAIAQVHRGGDSLDSLGQLHRNPGAAVEHLSKFFPIIASFDANKDGELDAKEKEALAKAITDGTVQIPAHTPPHGVKPSPEMMVNHISEMYAYVAVFDVNHDGQLDAKEQAALKSAIEAGEFTPHGLNTEHDGGTAP